MLPASVGAGLIAVVGGDGRDAQSRLVEAVVDLHIQQERVPLERVEGRSHDNLVLGLAHRLPGSPMQEAVDGVVLVRFGEGDLIVCPVETVAAVTEPIGPRDQRGAVGAVAHRLQRIGLQHVPITGTVAADAAADLDDRDLLISVADYILPTGWRVRHDVSPFRVRGLSRSC